MLTKNYFFLFGAGGHAKVVYDTLKLLDKDIEELIIVDDSPKNVGRSFFDKTIVDSNVINKFSDFSFHVSIGDNNFRRKVTERLVRCGGVSVSIIHPKSILSTNANVHLGTFIAAGSILASDSYLADGVIVNHGAVVDHDCEIGSYSHVAPNATLCGGVKVGSGVLVGAGAVILPGVSIGDGSIIGAGAVVVNDVPALSKVIGYPSRYQVKENKF